jgi:hypothetical protein
MLTSTQKVLGIQLERAEAGGRSCVHTVPSRDEPGCEIGMEACTGAHCWCPGAAVSRFHGGVDCAAVREALREEQQERRLSEFLESLAPGFCLANHFASSTS